MQIQNQIRGFGGFARRDMNGRPTFLIEQEVKDVLIAQDGDFLKNLIYLKVNLRQEALTRLLVENGIFTKEEFRRW